MDRDVVARRVQTWLGEAQTYLGTPVVSVSLCVLVCMYVHVRAHAERGMHKHILVVLFMTLHACACVRESPVRSVCSAPMPNNPP